MKQFIVFRPEVCYRAYLVDAETSVEACNNADSGTPIVVTIPNEVKEFQGLLLSNPPNKPVPTYAAPIPALPWVVIERPSPEEFLQKIEEYER